MIQGNFPVIILLRSEQLGPPVVILNDNAIIRILTAVRTAICGGNK